jgi:hypothetical protein
MSVPILLLLLDHGLSDGIPYCDRVHNGVQKVLGIQLLCFDVLYGVIMVFGYRISPHRWHICWCWLGTMPVVDGLDRHPLRCSRRHFNPWKCLVEVIAGKYLQVVVMLWFGWYQLGQRAVLGAEF